MTTLLIIGLLALLALCLFLTVAAVGCFFDELMWGGITPMSAVLIGIATAAWSLLFWLQPLSISISIAPL